VTVNFSCDCLGLPTQFCAACGAGFFMATTVAPFDMIRTRLMNQPADARVYKGFLDCATKIIAKDGFGGLYAGDTLTDKNFTLY